MSNCCALNFAARRLSNSFMGHKVNLFLLLLDLPSLAVVVVAIVGVVLTEDVDAADAALKNVVVSAAAERLREQCISHVC